MALQVTNEELGINLPEGFTLFMEDDHFTALYYKGERIALFLHFLPELVLKEAKAHLAKLNSEA